MIDKSKLYYVDVVKMESGHQHSSESRSLFGVAIVKILFVSHDEKQAIVRQISKVAPECSGMIFNEKILYSKGNEIVTTMSRIVNCEDLFKSTADAHDSIQNRVCCDISFGDLVAVSNLALKSPAFEKSKFFHDGIHVNELPWIVTKINKKTGNLNTIFICKSYD